MLMVFVAVFILICEHVIPMFIVRRDPERVLEVLLPPFDVAARFVQPLTQALVAADRRCAARPSCAAAGRPTATRRSQRGAGAGEPTRASEQRLMEGDERRLLQSIVDFGDTLVREVMTPRPDIVAIEDAATVGAAAGAVPRAGVLANSRSTSENLDNIVGVVFVKDLIRLTDDDSDDGAGIQPLLRPATFVPETKRVSDLLKEFQRKQVQLAIVVDEYGGTAGLVTLEDLLEEIVGEIRDEYDVEAEPVVEDGHGHVRVQRQGQLRRGARPAARRGRAGRVRDRRRLRADPRRPRAVGRRDLRARRAGRRSGRGGAPPHPPRQDSARRAGRVVETE